MAESKSFRLRGESLATAARTLLHLSVAALSDDDQVAAKAALVRVINEAFARAEPSFSSRDGESDEANESINPSAVVILESAHLLGRLKRPHRCNIFFFF